MFFHELARNISSPFVKRIEKSGNAFEAQRLEHTMHVLNDLYDRSADLFKKSRIDGLSRTRYYRPAVLGGVHAAIEKTRLQYTSDEIGRLSYEAACTILSKTKLNSADQEAMINQILINQRERLTKEILEGGISPFKRRKIELYIAGALTPYLHRQDSGEQKILPFVRVAK